MKKIVFLVLVICASYAMSRAQEQITFTRFEGQKITGLNVDGAWEIELTQGKNTKAVFSLPRRYESQLVVSIDQHGKLKIGFSGEVRFKAGEKCVVEVICPSMNKIELGGVCRLKGMGEFVTDYLKFDLAGAAQVQFPEKLTITDKVKIETSGAAKIFAYMMVPDIDIEVSGAASLTLKGNADSGKIELSGAAKVDMGDFEVQQINMNVSGAGKLKLNVSERIEGDISGAGKVAYQGNALTKVEVAGAGNLRHY